jgi:hypothetical protein
VIMFPKTYNIKRTNASGSYDESGNYIEGNTSGTPTTILADIQPMTNKEMTTLNIGQDSDNGMIVIYTDEELIITEKGNNNELLQQGDLITFDNEDYEVIKKDKYENNLINHNKFIGVMK